MPQATIEQAIQIALQHHQAGRLAEAESIYRQVLAAQPNHADALHLLGSLRHFTGHADGITLIRQAIAIKPHYPAALSNLGEALRGRGQFDEAIACFRRALVMWPDFPAALGNLGLALASIGENEQAVEPLRRAVALQPDFTDAWGNMGGALANLGKRSEAIACYQRAIVLRPTSADFHYNLGLLLRAENQIESAIASYRRAISLQPNYAAARCNLAMAIGLLGQYDLAIAELRIAIKLNPDLAERILNLAMQLMLMGQWAEGWREFEWRWKIPGFPEAKRTFSQPQWDGSDLNGRRILIHTEQGVGDAIQFIRYLPLGVARGGRVMVEVQPQLARLLEKENSQGAVVITRAGFDAPPAADFDVHLPLMSLPLLMDKLEPTSAPDLPRPPYLRAPASLKEKWRQLVGEELRLKVGLVFAGSTMHKNDHNRSIPLAKLSPLADERVQFYSLQLGPPAKQGGLPMIDLTSHITDFADTAAFIEELDLIVSVDTAVPHLAGAMGKSAWVLLPFSPDFRWQLNREDCDWYPALRLFRQVRPADWDEPIDRLARELKALASRWH